MHCDLGPGRLAPRDRPLRRAARSQPVLAIVGQQARTAIGGHYQQEVDLLSMFKDVAGAFVEQASAPGPGASSGRPRRADRAWRRRVTAIILPNDLQELPFEEPPRKHGTLHSGVGFTQPKTVPYDDDLRRAAEVLNSGKKVAILVGAGALAATDEVIAVADRLGAGRRQGAARQGGAARRPAVGDGIDRHAWHQAQLGPDDGVRHAADDRLRLSVFGVPAQGRQGARRADRYRARHAVAALSRWRSTSSATRPRRCARLLPLLEQKTDDGLAKAIERNVLAMVEDPRRARAWSRRTRSIPQRVTWELSPRLPDNVILTSDSGSCANWYARDLKMRRGMMASLSGGLASMGAAVPYAIAAKFAHPDRPVIALVGDGAMQMNNMAELITVAKYWRDWLDHRWIVCVFNNEDLNQVTWEQRVMEGDPKFDASQQIPNVPYHKFAELIGLKGIYVDRPEAVGPAWDEALAADRPVVLNVKTDPEVPPLPPHITFDEAVKSRRRR